MNWQPLNEIDQPFIGRGYVFRFPAEYPFEGYSEFMVIEDYKAPIQLKLICVTGYHAGQTELIFPNEAGENYKLSTQWLKVNWQKWVCKNSDVSDVCYLENYSVFEEKQTLTINTLDIGWRDKDTIMLHACFQLLSDCVEKEQLLNNHINWGRDEKHQQARNEIEALYQWWNTYLEQNIPDDQSYETENNMLSRLIDVRWALWT